MASYTHKKQYTKKDGSVSEYSYDYRKYKVDRAKYDDKRFTCICGSNVKFYDKKKHFRSKKCEKFRNNVNVENQFDFIEFLESFGVTI